MSNPTITLPDPKDGSPVELEIDPACPYFKFDEANKAWMFRSNPTIDEEAVTWPNEILEYLDELSCKPYLIPLVASVKVCWWEAKASALPRLWIEDDDAHSLVLNSGYWCRERDREIRALCDKADAWRKFTARPEGM